MIQNFKPIEWGQYGSHQEEISSTHGMPHGPDHTSCNTPNPPPGCEDYAPSVNVDAYVPMLILIAVVMGLMKLQKFKITTYGKVF